MLKVLKTKREEILKAKEALLVSSDPTLEVIRAAQNVGFKEVFQQEYSPGVIPK